MEWNDRYRIGVEHIDKQHQGLFSAINRVLRILDERNYDRSKRACIEAIKYLKNYTLHTSILSYLYSSILCHNHVS